MLIEREYQMISIYSYRGYACIITSFEGALLTKYGAI